MRRRPMSGPSTSKPELETLNCTSESGNQPTPGVVTKLAYQYHTLKVYTRLGTPYDGS